MAAKARCPAAESKGRREAFEETLQKCDGLDWHCNSRAFKDWLCQKRDACGAVKEPGDANAQTLRELEAKLATARDGLRSALAVIESMRGWGLTPVLPLIY